MQYTVPSYLPRLQQPLYASYNLLKNKVLVHIQRIQPSPYPQGLYIAEERLKDTGEEEQTKLFPFTTLLE